MYTYFTHMTDASTATDDSIYYVMRRIFITNSFHYIV